VPTVRSRRALFSGTPEDTEQTELLGLGNVSGNAEGRTGNVVSVPCAPKHNSLVTVRPSSSSSSWGSRPGLPGLSSMSTSKEGAEGFPAGAESETLLAEVKKLPYSGCRCPKVSS